ncbi:MAG TPA: hypothetical protein DCX27_20180, partial [Balneola sp.]|nr:hypothetical protein [Balneola sp.]
MLLIALCSQYKIFPLPLARASTEDVNSRIAPALFETIPTELDAAIIACVFKTVVALSVSLIII